MFSRAQAGCSSGREVHRRSPPRRRSPARPRRSLLLRRRRLRTCRVKLTTGNVVMDQHSALTTAEVDARYILACQAHSTTDNLALDYDAG